MQGAAGRELFYYEGSLTTPDCDEVVHWVVMKQAVPCSYNQLADLTRRANNTYRNIQAVNDRLIYDVTLG